MPQVTISFDIPEKLCRDIIITACEGGIGYWATLRDYNGPAIDNREVDSLPLYLRENDHMDDDEWIGRWLTLDVNAVVKGIQTLLQDYPESVAARNITGAITGFESGNYDYDAGDADAVVQCGVLGEIVYG